MTSDAKLVAAAAAGDGRAFGEIVRRYQSLVCAVALSGTRNVALSEEVAQDTFVQAWLGLGGLREPEKLKAWLAGIARNLIKSDRRSRARAREQPLPEATDPASPGPSPLVQLLDDERQALVWRALEDVPETYREPLVLFYREDRSVERVAEALDLSTDAVKQRLARGRQMLRDQVAELVEGALAQSRPGKAFTLAVLAALPALAPQAAAAAVAAGAAEVGVAKGAAATALGAAAWGPLAGLAGAYLGARASITNTKSARERRFMVRTAWMGASVALAFAAAEILGLLFLPSVFATLAGQLVLGGLYTTLLVIFILRTNRRQRQIRIEDGTFADPRDFPPPDLGTAPARAIYASFAGSVFGSLCWMPIMAVIARDYAVALAAIVLGAVLYTVCVRAALRRPRRFFRISMAETAVIGVFTAIVVNAHWEAWMVAYRRTTVYEPLADLPLWAMNVLLAAVYLWVFLRMFQLDLRHGQGPATSGS